MDWTQTVYLEKTQKTSTELLIYEKHAAHSRKNNPPKLEALCELPYQSFTKDFDCVITVTS